MKTKINLSDIYMPSENVVAREVQGEFIIIPLTSDIGDLEDEIYTLNETGLAIWNNLDGKRSLKDLADKLSSEFKTPAHKDIQKDILGLAEELLKRKMLIAVKR